jgi:hypothetical protein
MLSPLSLATVQNIDDFLTYLSLQEIVSNLPATPRLVRKTRAPGLEKLDPMAASTSADNNHVTVVSVVPPGSHDAGAPGVG